MSPAELDALFETARVVLAFDTNAIFAHGGRFYDLCDDINRINDKRPLDGRIDKVISTPVLLEKLHDLRQKHGPHFDPVLVDELLVSKGVAISGFDRDHAEHAAQLIYRAHPTGASWRDFKRGRCLACLGLSGAAAEQAPGNGRRCPATTDWLIAGHADKGAWVLVTDDTGPEFEAVERRARLHDVCEWARALALRLDS